MIRQFFSEIDGKWRSLGPEPITLQIIGSAALMLQAKYERGTKDGDVLETREVTPEVKGQLLAIAGKDTEMHQRHRLYLDIVLSGLPFLPQRPIFHPALALKGLKHFRFEVLDIVDTAVSKLKRFNANDRKDIQAMAERELLDPARLRERFKAAVDAWSMDARAQDLKKAVRNLNIVERDFLLAQESQIDLPEWVE